MGLAAIDEAVSAMQSEWTDRAASRRDVLIGGLLADALSHVEKKVVSEKAPTRLPVRDELESRVPRRPARLRGRGRATR